MERPPTPTISDSGPDVLLALSVTLGAVTFAALLFIALFRFLDPEIVKDDYKPCAGGWHEAVLRNCGAGLLAVPQQPVNTYTNLAYLAAGLFPAVLLSTPASYVYAFTMTYLCVGSTLYHATSTRWGGMIDVTAIYAVYAALGTYAAFVLLRVPEWLMPGSMFSVAGIVAYVFTPRHHRRMQLVIGVFLGTIYVLLVLQMWLRSRWEIWPLVTGSLALFATAFLIWRMDRMMTFPLRRWGHGCWHVLTAAATGLLFYAIHESSV